MLEDLWKVRQGEEKQWVQGLILAAAAFVHVQKNEMTATWSLLAEALHRLKGVPDHYYGWNTRDFQVSLARVLDTKSIDFPTV